MDLFSLVAKLTLDAAQYKDALDQAQAAADGFEPPDDHELELDNQPYIKAIDEAQESSDGFESPEDEELDLDEEPYTKAIDEAQEAADGFESPDGQTLTLDNTTYKESLKDATTESDLFSSGVQGIFSELSGAITGLGIAGVVAGIVNELKQGVELAQKHGDMIDKQSQKMGISAQAYQEWSYALELSGANITDLNRGMRSWQAAIGDESKMKDLGEAFKAIGVDAESAFEKIKSGDNLDALLNDTIMGLAKLSPGERGLIGKTLFGNNWNQLNPLLANTAEQIADMKEEAHDLGMIMTDEEVKNAAAYSDAVTRLQNSLNGIKEAFAADLLPALTDAANSVAKIIAMFNWRGDPQGLTNIFDKIDKDGVTALVDLNAQEAKAVALIDKIAEMGDYWTLDTNGQKTFDALARELVDIFPQLDKVINNNKNAIFENTNAIKENIKEWTNLEKQRIIDENLVKKRTAIAEQYATALEKETEAEVKETDAEGYKVKAFAELDRYFTQGRGKAYLPYLKSIGYTGEMTDEMYHKIGSGWIDNLLSESGYKDSDASRALKTWKDSLDEIEALRKEAKKLTDEADELQKDYAVFEKKLAEKVGVTVNEAESAGAASEGLDQTAESAEKAAENVKALQEFINGLKDKSITINADVNVPFWSKLAGFFSNAKGNWSVPYDNFPALLHRDEMVLTKSQARQFREGGSGGSPDGSAIASAVTAAMSKVFVMLNGEKVGDLTTRRIDHNINASSYSKLRAMGG